MAIQMSTTLRNAMGDSITTVAGNASLIRHYSGSIPANVAASITGTLLGEQVAGSPWAGSSASGVTTANAIANDASADNTGTASHFRHWKADGTTGVQQGTTGTSGADLNLNTTSIVSGGPIAISSFVETMPGA